MFNYVLAQDNLGFHHDGDEDERFAHEGTLEYTSRDGHIGAHSRQELATNVREVSQCPISPHLASTLTILLILLPVVKRAY